MNKVSDAIMQGKSIQLNIAGISGKPSWSSSNSNIATVSDGIVTGVSVGTATITAKYGGVSYTCNITVEAVKYGSVSGSVTYLYNNFRGNVSDTGATVILISTDGSLRICQV